MLQQQQLQLPPQQQQQQRLPPQQQQQQQQAVLEWELSAGMELSPSQPAALDNALLSSSPTFIVWPRIMSIVMLLDHIFIK